MDTIDILKDICNYYKDLKCKKCPFGEKGFCALKLGPDKWDRDKIDKICQEWKDNSVVFRDLFELLMPEVNESFEHCPTILDSRWNCYLLQDGSCEKCWEKFLGQRISKNVIRALLDGPEDK